MATALTVGGWFAQAAIQTSIDILSSSTIQQDKSYPNLNGSLLSLNTSLSKAKAILDVSHKMMKVEEHLTDLLKQLKEAVYDASDLLGELQYEEVKLKVEGKGGQLSGFLPDALKFLSDLLKDATGKVRELQKRLDEIASAIEQVVNISMFVGDNGEKQQSETSQGRDPTSSFLLDPEVFGRATDLERLTELLLKPVEASQSSNKVVVPVISLVGMGGVGKTTLAQWAYSELEEKFEEKIWICASDPFDVKRLTREIVETVDKENSTLAKFDKLQGIVMRKLASKRFLLVVDDVWNEDWRKWETFYAPLRYGAPGSKILVTTRSLKVAETIKSMHKMPLEGLLEDDYYSLFKKCAFGNEDSTNYPKLESMGKKIAGRLKGIPLAAKTLGSLLNSDLDEMHWKTVMESETWDLKQDENDILPVLKLSYDYLPSCLQQCFAYCSLFPKDFEFKKDTLIQMWMAQGFITSQGKLMEDVGRGYVKDLLSRGFFEHVPGNDGRMMMHDLLHDLAQSISKDECYRIDNGKPQKIPCTIYHLSVCDPNLEPCVIIDICNQHKKLRTLLFVWGTTRDLSVELNQLLSGLTCIRVLVLEENCVTDELPGNIGNLKQLRYLDVSRTNVQKLLEPLCRLYNLQVLKLDRAYKVSFPKGVTNLVNLRHLSANWSSVSMIADIGKLTSLQDLRLFTVRKGYMVEELKNMIELQGLLHIEHLENIDSKEEAGKAKLDNKIYLKELVFEWAYERHTDLGVEISDAVIFEGLRPHSNLEDLKIVNYGGLQCPSWLEYQFLSNLVSIRLVDCKCMVRLPPLGQLPYLKVLKLKGLIAVKEVGEELYGNTQLKAFRWLKKLVFKNMPEWQKWSLGYSNQMLPCLEEIIIWNCPKIKVLPMLPPKVERLEIIGMGLDAFPPLGHLSCLKTLHYGGLHKVRKVEDLFRGTESKGFPSLEILKFADMTELEEWSGAYGSHLFPCLVEVSIYRCPKLRNLPCLPPSLEKLGLDEVGLDALPGVWFGSHVVDVSQDDSSRQSVSLSQLSIRSCPKLKSLEDLLLPNQLQDIKEISIIDCGELTSLAIERFKDFSCLQSLRLRDCLKLTSSVQSGEGENNLLFPSSLKQCYLGCCGDLDRPLLLCLRGATSLSQLTLSFCEHITSIPGEFGQHMTALECLKLENLTKLKTLKSLQCFTSLKDLEICNCPQLKAMPEDSLPASLGILCMCSCHPELKERCQKDTGSDWPKIAHIPNLGIDGYGGFTGPHLIQMNYSPMEGNCSLRKKVRYFKPLTFV